MARIDVIGGHQPGVKDREPYWTYDSDVVPRVGERIDGPPDAGPLKWTVQMVLTTKDDQNRPLIKVYAAP